MISLNQFKNIKKNDQIIIKDEITIKDAISNGAIGAVDGIETTVRDAYTVKESSGACEWCFIQVTKNVKDKGNSTYFIVIKSVEEDYDVRVYQENDWFKQGSRADIVNRNDLFIFADPGVTEWKPKDLEYAVSFPLCISNKEVYFNQKNPTLYGNDGENTSFVTIISEYLAVEPVDNSDILIVEMAGIRDGKMWDSGGWVMFLEGRLIKPNEVELFS